MKKNALLALAVVLLSTALSLCVVGLLELQIAYASPYTNINVNTAYNMITNGSYPDLVVLDVRTKSEYDGGHIYGAVWIPYDELDGRIGELAGHENHEIIVYCLSGGRSATASGILDSHSFTKVYNMLGGISAWQTAGYPVWSATVHNVDTTFNYDTIQAAIDAPQTLNGHTILVDAETYYENVVVNKSLTLQGEDKGTTIIQSAAPDKPCISITSDSVTVSNFTVRNAWNTTAEGMWFSHGISVSQSNDVTLSDLVVYNNTCFGIWFMGGNDADIHDNNLYNNTYGLVVVANATSSTGHAIHHNNFYNNTVGIELWAMEGGLISNSAVHHNTLCNVSFIGMFLGVSEGGSLNNTEIYHNNVSNTYYGIHTYIEVNGSIEYTNIHDNNVFNGENGITSTSNNTIIRENTVYNCTTIGIGAFAYSGTHIMYNGIVSNEVHHCGVFGIGLYAQNGGSLSHSDVSYNDAHHNDYGIFLMGSVSNSAVHHNKVYNNTLHGMCLMFGPANNIAYSNEISCNRDGIWINGTSNIMYGNTITKNNEHGIYLEGESSNNTFYHNNIIDNTQQVGIETPGYANFWDDGVEGNYWSNYTGVDLNHDGIGDTVHYIGANNTDHYPLMGMFHSFNASPDYSVNVISNSTIEDFTFFVSNSTIRMYVSNSSATQLFGFCRICIPKNLMSPPYIVVINDGSTLVLYFNSTVYENDTHIWIYFAYEHSTHKIEIIPEFPTWTPMLLILIVLTVAIAIYKRRLLKTLIQ